MRRKLATLLLLILAAAGYLAYDAHYHTPSIIDSFREGLREGYESARHR